MSSLVRIEKILSHLSAVSDNNSNIEPNDISNKMYKILLCGSGYPLYFDVEKYLQSLGHSVVRLPYLTNAKEGGKCLYQHVVIEKNIDYDAVINGGLPFSKIINGIKLPNLKIISYPSSGVPSDDILYCKKYNISMTNVPTETASTAADLTVGLMIATSRQFFRNTLYWKNNTKQEMSMNKEMNSFFGFCQNTKDLYRATVGIVGLGNIGRQIAKRLSKGFDCNVFYFNGENKERKLYDFEYGAQYISSFDELIKMSDFVVAICPLNDNTRCMFNERVFKMMKNDAIFINVGRGGLCDTNDLIKAIKNKWIAAAGLDVTDPEPLPKDHELWRLENVTILPHIGTATLQCRTKMMNLAVDNMLKILNNKPCSNNIIS